MIIILKNKNVHALSYFLSPLMQRLNNVVNERTRCFKILRSFFRFMFGNFLLNTFSLVNNGFQMLNLRL